MSSDSSDSDSSTSTSVSNGSEVSSVSSSEEYENTVTKKKARPAAKFTATPKSSKAGKGARKKLVTVNAPAAVAVTEQKDAKKRQSKRKVRLTKCDIKQVCEHIASQVDILFERIQASVLNIKSKYTSTLDMKVIVKSSHFKDVVGFCVPPLLCWSLSVYPLTIHSLC